MKKFFTRIPRKYKISIFFLLGLFSITSVSWKPIAINYGQWLAAGELNPTGDMSVLLSGSEKRLETLIKLFEKGNVNAVYYAAGVDETLSDLESYRRIFSKYDIPIDNLYCGELVRSTFHEAQAFQRKLREFKRPVDKIVLVSDRYHLRRGIWSFQQVLGNDIEITAYSTPSSPEIAALQWWKYPAARQQVLRETQKLAFYMLYYGLLDRELVISHGDVNKVFKGKASKGIDEPCQIVLPQLANPTSLNK